MPPTRSRRLTTRVYQSDRALLERAASKRGISLSEFLRRYALQAARSIVEESPKADADELEEHHG